MGEGLEAPGGETAQHAIGLRLLRDGRASAPPLSAYRRLRGVLRGSPALRHAVVYHQHWGLRVDDIFVASYPRSGNTWIRFLLADLATGLSPDFVTVDRLIPSVGHHSGAPALASGRRLIKTHEPYRPEYRHAVYFVRDVRDVLVSWYRVTRTDPNDLRGLDEFVKAFMTRRASPYGFWCDHVRGWQRARQQGADILICRFEDLRADPRAVVRELARFVGVNANDEQIARALHRNTAERMRELERASTAYLRRVAGQRSPGVRGGVTGTWRGLLTERHLRLLGPALKLNTQLGYAS